MPISPWLVGLATLLLGLGLLVELIQVRDQIGGLDRIKPATIGPEDGVPIVYEGPRA
jgi:hypothetical protein